jgi:hypothetical protein
MSALGGEADIPTQGRDFRLDPKRTSAWLAGNMRLNLIRPFLKDDLAR